MKRFLPLLFALPLLFTACENVLPTEGVDMTVLTESKLNTEPVLYKGKVVDTDNFVSATALNAYLELQPNRAERSKRSVASIEPTGPNSDVTLMYVVNYEGGGWEIISADKRTEPILACSDYGSFSWEKANPGEIAWMGGIGEGLLHLRTAGPDAKLNDKAAKEKEQNVAFWDGLELTKAFVDINGADALKDAVPATEKELEIIRAGQTRNNDEGYYQLVSSVQTEVVADSLPHLTATRWAQGAPWNYYCGTNKVGCVAVAGAQMLYFLHYVLGTPYYAQLDQSFYTEYPTLNDFSVWGTMACSTNNTNTMSRMAAARLMYEVGVMVDMNYGSNQSTASTSDLPSKVFAPYGIDCTCSGYDSSDVIDAMYNDMMPSIVRADGTVLYDESGNPTYSDGHSFIVDGYKRCRIVTTKTYEWISTNFDPGEISVAKPRITETINGSPYIKYVCMNWGWATSHDSIWYLPDSSWVVNGYSNGNSVSYDYQYRRKMITGFRKQ